MVNANAENGKGGGGSRKAMADRATHMAGMWLHRANIANERGNRAEAERLYEKAQRWHDRMNALLGND